MVHSHVPFSSQPPPIREPRSGLELIEGDRGMRDESGPANAGCPSPNGPPPRFCGSGELGRTVSYGVARDPSLGLRKGVRLLTPPKGALIEVVLSVDLDEDPRLSSPSSHDPDEHAR